MALFVTRDLGPNSVIQGCWNTAIEIPTGSVDVTALFLRMAAKKAVVIRKPPGAMTDQRAAVLQTQRYWVSALIQQFGSAERLVYCLERTNEFRPFFTEDKQAKQRYAEALLDDTLRKTQHLWDEKTPMIIKSGTASARYT